MNNVAFIPVRGGSKSIPLKNIKEINGRPLVYWTIKAACECNSIDTVYVATDSEAIRNTVNAICREFPLLASKVEVIGRSAETASDTASTESAMLEFANNYVFDNIVLIQATSPLLESKDLNSAFCIYESGNVDSVMSAVPQKRFNWAVNGDGYASATNYDYTNRPRRQDFDAYYVENGAFYITSRDNLLKFRNRLSGRIKIAEMSEDSFLEIDEPSDWRIIEAIMKNRPKESDFSKIKMVLTDCDGCLTDGGMYYSENGDELKKFNTKDGMAMKLLREKGIKTGIITGEERELNRRRAEKIKVDYYYSNCTDKMEIITNICSETGISLNELLYIGDDINDLEVIKKVGIGVCPADAVDEIRDCANYVCKSIGGSGVVREIAAILLKNR